MTTRQQRDRVLGLLEDKGRGLSSIQLATFLRGDPEIVKSKTFVRVVPRDLLSGGELTSEIWLHLLLNQRHGPSVAVICNNQRSDQPGEHWVLVYWHSGAKNVDFFCSYGLEVQAYPREIRNFCKRLSDELCLARRSDVVRSNKTCLQGLFSSVCGHLCMLFVLLRVRNYSSKEFVDLLKTVPPGENDEIVPKILLDNRLSLRYDVGLERKFRRTEFRDCPIQCCCRRIDSSLFFDSVL
jgi:Adenovirus endoprotease